jgi:hypothetical protein
MIIEDYVQKDVQINLNTIETFSMNDGYYAIIGTDQGLLIYLDIT